MGRGIALLFHDRRTRRGWVVSSTPRRTLPAGKNRYPFYRRLGGPQGRSERAKNLVPIGIRSPTVQPVVSRYTDWATELTRATVHENNYWIFVELYCEWKPQVPRERPVSMALRPPQISHWLTSCRNRASATKGRPLTSSTMAQTLKVKIISNYTYRFSAYCAVNINGLIYIHQEFRAVYGNKRC